MIFTVPPGGWSGWTGPPIEVAIALWLLALSPGAVTFGVARRLGATGAFARRGIHGGVCIALAIACVGLLGLPRVTALTPWAAVAGLLGGGVYYVCERGRLALAHHRALRTSGRTEWTGVVGHGLGPWLTGGASLVAAGTSEELLFRWYALFVPVWYGVIGMGASVVLSATAYAVLHHDLGAGTMTSRGMLGLILGGLVALTGQLLVTVLIHAIYNLCVYLRPVQYLRVKEGMAT